MRVLIAFLSLATVAAAGQAPALPAVEALFAAFARPDTPGAVVAVERDGELLHLAAYGVRNRDAGDPLAADTPVYLASVSKQFTAACIAHLAEAGTVELDDSIRKYLPALPAYCDAITVRHLVHHRSGLRDFYDLLILARRDLDRAVERAEVLALVGKQAGLDFAPGEECRYSNTNYFLLAEIVRAVSGRSLREYAAAELFAPLGMQRSCFVDDPAQAQGFAVGHTSGGGGHVARHTKLALPGSGGMYATAEDLLRWLRNFDTGEWGGKQLTALLVQPPLLTPPQRRAPDLGDYAFGIVVRQHHGRRIEFHPGGAFGYQTCLLRVPSERLHVAVLGNAGDLDADGKALAIVDAVLGTAPAATPAAPVDLPRPGFTLYRDAAGDLAVLSCKAGGRGTLTTLSFKVAVRALSPTEFAGDDTPLAVRVAVQGDRLELRVDDETARIFTKVEPQPPAPPDVVALAGTWQADEIDAKLELRVDGGRLRLDDRGMELRVPPFVALSRDQFLSDAGVRIDVERDAAGTPTALRVSTGRARGIRAVRAKD